VYLKKLKAVLRSKAWIFYLLLCVTALTF